MTVTFEKRILNKLARFSIEICNWPDAASIITSLLMNPVASALLLHVTARAVHFNHLICMNEPRMNLNFVINLFKCDRHHRSKYVHGTTNVHTHYKKKSPPVSFRLPLHDKLAKYIIKWIYIRFFSIKSDS